MSEDCVHHWIVTAPRSGFSRSKARGDLVETSLHECKKCGLVRLNKVVVPNERAANPESELGFLR